MEGIIFDIERFAVHDGPGIRTALFTKGCRLNCIWCHNPEGILLGIQIWQFHSKCIGCLQCISVCPEKAIRKASGLQTRIVIDRGKCTLCGKCVDICPTKALAFDGQIMSSEEVIEELLKDRIFYEESGGGVTITGGEPLVQANFNLEISERLKHENIHVAIESCLHAELDVLKPFTKVIDLFIVDLKIFNSEKHRFFTGQHNATIIKNFTYLSSADVDIIVRIPLVPGITADENNLGKIAEFVYETNRKAQIELINYNRLGSSKYQIMDKKFDLNGTALPFTKEQVSSFQLIIERAGVHCVEE